MPDNIPALRVLVVTQHYWPETVGTARRAQLLAEHLAARGHTVEVVCGQPNHPSMAHLFNAGHDRPELHHGVQLRRLALYRSSTRLTRTDVPTDTSASASATSVPPLSAAARAHRIATYGTWMTRGLVEATLPRGRWDVIVAVSPLPTGLVGAGFSRRCGAPLVFDLQDIWPEAAVQAGILRDVALIRMVERLERWLYTRTRALVVLSEGFARNLEAKGISRDTVHVLPNAVDLKPHLRADGSSIRREWALTPADTLVVYAGNLGLMQDLDVLLEAAAGLKHVKTIRFLLVGEGVDKERLQQQVEARGLTQVRFMGHQPLERMPALLAASDVCFLALRSGAFTPGTIPSKLYEYLAAARPVINLVSGDTARTVEAAEAGINLVEGDALALRVALFGLHADPALRRKMGAAGRGYVAREASIEVIGTRYESLLRSLVPSKL